MGLPNYFHPFLGLCQLGWQVLDMIEDSVYELANTLRTSSLPQPFDDVVSEGTSGLLQMLSGVEVNDDKNVVV